jgi:lipoprotein-releasing system ATP-binding protein
MASAEKSEQNVSLQVDDVTKTFETDAGPVAVLKGVSLEAAAGDAVAVVGPSGCGKSTLLQLVGTLDEPTSGTITIAGQNPFALKERELARFRNRTIGFVFQDHHLLPQYTVLENVFLPALADPSGGKGGESARARGTRLEGRARELLERVGLSHRLDHRPAQLSGGERQRVAIARALVLDPALVLCDEPTGNLDSTTADAVADLLFELHEQEGGILLVITHSGELAARFPRRLTLQEGRCVEL